MAFVLDASVALSWTLPDEDSPKGDALLDALREDLAVVPSLWIYEVGNALLVATRRKRITETQRAAALRYLSGLPIEVDPESVNHLWLDGLALADRHTLSLYDAAYLETARRWGLPLATLDDDLRRAAKVAHVPLAL